MLLRDLVVSEVLIDGGRKRILSPIPKIGLGECTWGEQDGNEWLETRTVEIQLCVAG